MSVLDPADPSSIGEDRLPPLERRRRRGGRSGLGNSPPQPLAEVESVVHSGPDPVCQRRGEQLVRRQQRVFGGRDLDPESVLFRPDGDRAE